MLLSNTPGDIYSPVGWFDNLENTMITCISFQNISVIK